MAHNALLTLAGKGVKTCSFQSSVEISGAAYLPCKQPITTLDLAKRDVFLKTLALFRALRLRGCASRTSEEVRSADANSSSAEHGQLATSAIKQLRRKLLVRMKQARHFLKLGLPAAAVRKKIASIKLLSKDIARRTKMKGPVNACQASLDPPDIQRDSRSRLKPICPGRVIIEKLSNGRKIVQ